MKILFLAPLEVDYLAMNLLHGLSLIEDIQIFVCENFWYMYKGNKEEELASLYGRGYTYANRMEVGSTIFIEKEEVEQRIENHFFDCVIYGAANREVPFWETVVLAYKKSEIIICDGDDLNFNPTFRWGGHFMPIQGWRITERKKMLELAKHAIAFKREIRDREKEIFNPISFAIPEDILVDSIPEKTRDMAFIYPGKVETYIYKTEKSYFEGYRESRFGTTFKKGGWDCMRHYEILANGCIPYFPDILECPKHTMVNFPKSLIMETNRLYENGGISEKVYVYYAEQLLDYTRRYLVTTELAKYILSFINC